MIEDGILPPQLPMLDVEYTPEAIERMMAADVAAQNQLNLDLEPHRYATDYRDCIPAFQKYGKALLDAEAAELIAMATSDQVLNAQLTKLTERIVDRILPPDPPGGARHRHAYKWKRKRKPN